MATACISAQPEVTLLPVSLGITQQPPATTSQPVGKGCLMVANWCVGLCELENSPTWASFTSLPLESRLGVTSEALFITEWFMSYLRPVYGRYE